MVNSFLYYYYYNITAEEISLPPFLPRAKQVSLILLLECWPLWQTVVWLELQRIEQTACCIFIKYITVKWHVTVSTVCFISTKSVSLSAGLILSLLSNHLTQGFHIIINELFQQIVCVGLWLEINHESGRASWRFVDTPAARVPLSRTYLYG